MARWKEASAISAGSAGSLVLLNQAQNPNAAKLFINWLLSREGQTAYQKASNSPINTEESMRTDIPKDMIPAEDRRLEGVKYMLFDRPEFMEMKPIYDILDRALAENKK